MNVDDVVAEKIAAARRRAEEAKRRRAALAANRKRGLALRHAAKLRNQAAPRQADESESLTTDDGSDDPDDVVVEVTEAEWHDGVRAALARLGLTYAELEDQARRRDFVSAQAQVLWVSIGGTVNTDLLGPQEETTKENS